MAEKRQSFMFSGGWKGAAIKSTVTVCAWVCVLALRAHVETFSAA